MKGDIIAYMREKIWIPSDFRKMVNRELTPGTILLATKESSTKETRSSGPIAIGVPNETPKKDPE